ncbi:MAG: CPBP family intramembrane glutamic endopeptidase [Thermoanaerobaculia bacterium]
MDAKGSRAEILLINLICFGPFAAMAIYRLVTRQMERVVGDAELLRIVGIEVVAGAVAVFILRRRGWKLREFGLRPTFPETILGMILMIAANLLIVMIYVTVVAFVGHPIADPGAKSNVSWAVLILVTLINPLYEEFFEVAYNLRAAGPKEGIAFAITLSALIRFTCHLDQGPIAAVTILPLGLIFAVVYWRWGRLWPLVVAHGAFDFFAMMPGGE